MIEPRLYVLQSVSLGPTTLTSLFVGLNQDMKAKIFEALQECVEDGAVSKDANGHPDLNVYSLTAIGRAELRK